jgi:signal transduction histidine kinase
VIGTGVRNIAEGDLESPIVVKQSTEFNRLANGINDMALQIKSMLEGKQQLLLAISHELRSPLTRAKVNIALLEENAMTQALQDDVNEMEALIGQILESERLNQRHAVLNKSEFYLDQLVEEVISSYFADAGVTCELESLKINADKTRLILLIKNLLDNAIKYTEQDSQPPVIRVYEKNTSIIIEVSDSGCGIEADELDNITQAFYRIDKARQRSTGGFGLGLYLCQLIVSAHHAKMNISSEHQAGTLVKVSFP